MHLIGDEIERITGYPADDFVENRVRSFMSLIHPDDRERVERDVWEAIEGDRQFELEYRVLTASGDERWVLERSGVFPALGRRATAGRRAKTVPPPRSSASRSRREGLRAPWSTTRRTVLDCAVRRPCRGELVARRGRDARVRKRSARSAATVSPGCGARAAAGV
jgi:hypothetical protein